MIGVLVCFFVMLVLHLITPYWWWIILVPLAYAFWRSDSGHKGFRTGAASAGLLWLAAGSYYLLNGGENIAMRIAEMLGTPTSFSVVILAALVAVLTAGISGLAGYQFRHILTKGRNPSQA